MYNLMQLFYRVAIYIQLISTLGKASNCQPNARGKASPGDTEGLKILTDPLDPLIDIVAVHGLDGHWKRSWTAENGTFWLQDLLPLFLPQARILAFSYDSRTRGSHTPLTLDISEHGRELVAELSITRQLTKTERIPIIFIGHSLGGLVIKSALVYSDMARVGHLERHRSVKLSTYGVVYLGTPHQGGEGVNIAKVVTRILSAVTHTNLKVLEQIMPNSDWLQDLQSRYTSISQEFETVYCYETQQTPLPVGSLLIVPKHSAVVFGAANSEAVALADNHKTMAKFGGINSPSFQKITRRVLAFSKLAAKKVDWNWKRWEHDRESQFFYTHSKDQQEHGGHTGREEFAVGMTFPSIRNRHFVGRGTELQHIDVLLEESSKQGQIKLLVLYGSGGMGKTQIALEYAHRMRHKYTSTFWIDGARNDTAAASVLSSLQEIERHYIIRGLKDNSKFRFIERALKTISDKGQDSLRQTFHTWLSYTENCSWLVIIDNVDDLEGFDLRRWLPSTMCGSIIVTSRRSDLAINWKSLEINELDEEEALLLLKQTGKLSLVLGTKEWESSLILVRTLGWSPLGVSQAGAYIAMSPTQEPVSNYLDLYKRYPKHLLGWRSIEQPWDMRKDTILTTWEISYNMIATTDRLAARILLLCGFLSPTAIQPEIFIDQSILKAQAFEVHQAFNLLYAFSFFKETSGPSNQVLSMHPLIHLWARLRLEIADQRRLAREAVIVLQQLSGRRHLIHSYDAHIAQVFQFFRQSSPCENPPMKTINITLMSSEEVASIPDNRFNSWTNVKGCISTIRGWVQGLWRDVKQKSLEDGYSKLSDWEIMYTFRNSWGQSRGIGFLEWVVCHHLRNFPPNHPRILEVIGYYASDLHYYSSDDRSTSRTWFQWLLIARTQVLGSEHVATAGAYVGLGASSPRCEEGLELLQKGCDLRIKALGYDDILTENAIGKFAAYAKECLRDSHHPTTIKWFNDLMDIKGVATVMRPFLGVDLHERKGKTLIWSYTRPQVQLILYFIENRGVQTALKYFRIASWELEQILAVFFDIIPLLNQVQWHSYASNLLEFIQATLSIPTNTYYTYDFLLYWSGLRILVGDIYPLNPFVFSPERDAVWWFLNDMACSPNALWLGENSGRKLQWGWERKWEKWEDNFFTSLELDVLENEPIRLLRYTLAVPLSEPNENNTRITLNRWWYATLCSIGGREQEVDSLLILTGKVPLRLL